jgi:hypothetical protein
MERIMPSHIPINSAAVVRLQRRVSRLSVTIVVMAVLVAGKWFIDAPSAASDALAQTPAPRMQGLPNAAAQRNELLD